MPAMRECLNQLLQWVGKEYAKELAFLALSGGVEGAVRDRLAWTCYHNERNSELGNCWQNEIPLIEHRGLDLAFVNRKRQSINVVEFGSWPLNKVPVTQKEGVQNKLLNDYGKVLFGLTKLEGVAKNEQTKSLIDKYKELLHNQDTKDPRGVFLQGKRASLIDSKPQYLSDVDREEAFFAVHCFTRVDSEAWEEEPIAKLFVKYEKEATGRPDKALVNAEDLGKRLSDVLFNGCDLGERLTTGCLFEKEKVYEAEVSVYYMLLGPLAIGEPDRLGVNDKAIRDYIKQGVGLDYAVPMALYDPRSLSGQTASELAERIRAMRGNKYHIFASLLEQHYDR